MTKKWFRSLPLCLLLAAQVLTAQAPQNPPEKKDSFPNESSSANQPPRAGQTSRKSAADDEPMVLLDVQAVRRDTGEPITTLAPSDLVLAEDGLTRPVKQLAYQRFPLSVVLVVNATRSFQPSRAKLGAGLRVALEKLGEKDEVALLAFGRQSQVIEGFTRDRKTIADQFGTLDDPALQKSLGEKPEIEKALMTAGGLMEKAAPRRRRVLVLLTSEKSFSLLPKPSRYSQADSPQVIQAGSTINGVIQVKEMGTFSKLLLATAVVGTFGLATPMAIQPPPVVQTWAARTGGEVFATERDGLATGLIALFERMRERVTLGFVPLNPTMDGSFRRLRLSASSRLERREGEVELRFPEGYLAKPTVDR
jgi:VWFA-related protein